MCQAFEVPDHNAGRALESSAGSDVTVPQPGGRRSAMPC